MIGAGSTYKRQRAARARSALPVARVRGLGRFGAPCNSRWSRQPSGTSLFNWIQPGLGVASAGRVSRVRVHIGYNRAVKTLCQVGSFLKIASNLREEPH